MEAVQLDLTGARTKHIQFCSVAVAEYLTHQLDTEGDGTLVMLYEAARDSTPVEEGVDRDALISLGMLLLDGTVRSDMVNPILGLITPHGDLIDYEKCIVDRALVR